MCTDFLKKLQIVEYLKALLDQRCGIWNEEWKKRGQFCPSFGPILAQFGLILAFFREIILHTVNNLISRNIFYAKVKLLLSRNFCHKCVRVNSSNFPYCAVAVYTMWKKNLLSLKKMFRQINCLVILLVKTLLSWNFCQKSVRVNCFHTVVYVEQLKFLSL